MKRILIFSFLVLAMAMTASAMKNDGDSIADAKLMRMAYQYRYGVMREVNPRKSAAIYMRLVKRGNIEAMNQLGKLYLDGDGVEQDFRMARCLFSMAAQGGNNDAKCNLALMYQKGMGVPLDNRKAFMLYKSAADAGNARGYYGAGYHLYKGLGVSQNYDKSVRMLEKGAEKGHSGCDLLLGAYYANDYDGKGDTEKAERHYRRASRHGNGWTIDLTKHNVLDSIQQRKAHRGKWKHMRNKTLPEKGMRFVNGNAGINEITGRWVGTAYAYDWSRTEILSEEDITLEVEAVGDSVKVSWYRGDSLCSEGMMGKNGERYSLGHVSKEQRDYPWLLTAAKFDCKDKEMYAALKTFSPVTCEKLHPVLAVLERKETSMNDNQQQTFTIQGVSTSNGNISVIVDAASDMTVNIELCSVTGMPIKTLGTRNLTAGHNKIEISALDLTKGLYSIVLTHKGERHSKTVTVRKQ